VLTEAAPDGAAEALERARAHARAASAEAILALRALLDAASLAATGAPADAHPSLSRLTRSAESFAATLNGEGPAPAALVGAIAQALDAEIARWEARAHDEPDARAVLRAYLGLREMLWELGVRRAASGRPAATDGAASPKRPRAARAPHGGEPPKRDARGARGRLERVPLG